MDRRGFLLASVSAASSGEGAGLGPDGLRLADGTLLPLMVWPACDASGARVEPWGVFLALHGMNDYAQAFSIAGPFWARLGVSVYAYDQRGFGRAPNRGRWPGAEALIADVAEASRLVRDRHPGARFGVVGESMGGAAAIAAFAAPNPPDADALVLLSPAVWGWREQPIWDRIALWASARLSPGARLQPPAWVYRSHPASDNLEVLRALGRDPNMIFDTRIDAVYGLVDLMDRAFRDIARLQAPALYAYGAHDSIIPQHAAFDAAARLPAAARTAYYPDGWHLLDRDLHAERVLADAAAFLRSPDAPTPSGAPPIPGRAR